MTNCSLSIVCLLAPSLGVFVSFFWLCTFCMCIVHEELLETYSLKSILLDVLGLFLLMNLMTQTICDAHATSHIFAFPSSLWVFCVIAQVKSRSQRIGLHCEVISARSDMVLCAFCSSVAPTQQLDIIDVQYIVIVV